jgi:transcription antitermination factor NusG
MTTAFWDGAFARKLRRNTVPRSKQQRIARAEAKANEKARLEEQRKPLDPARPIPQGLLWFALSVKSRSEFQVARWLEERQWFTLVPTKQVKTIINGKRGGKHRKETVKTYAELSGFVFAALPHYPDWISLESCRDIYGPLATQGTPMMLSEREATRFQQNAALSTQEALERASMADRLTRLRKALERGGTAKITDGPFRSFTIQVLSLKGDIARGSMSLFGGDTIAEFHLEQLDAA